MSASNRSIRRGVTRRSAFTLIELLVVIAVIAILISLLTPAVQSVRRSAFETVVATQISQMEAAVEEFKREFGFYPSDFSEFVKADGSVFGIDEGGVFGNPSLTPRKRLLQMLAKISPSHNEASRLDAWWSNVGANLASNGGGNGKVYDLRGPQVALWYWLTQLFNDAQYPLSGPRATNGYLADGAEQRRFYDFGPSELEVIQEVSDYFNPAVPYQIARVLQRGSTAPIFYSHNQTYLDPYGGNPTQIDFTAAGDPPNVACACPFPGSVAPLLVDNFIESNRFQIIAPGYDDSFGNVGDPLITQTYDNLCSFSEGRLDVYVENYQGGN